MSLIPHPILSAGLVLVWLLLNEFSLGHLVLGLIIALVSSWALGAIEGDRVRWRNPRTVFRLFCIVGLDIIRSNIAVASLILSGGRHGARRSAFIPIPLKMTDPVGLAVLAMIITATPGTAWIEHDTDQNVLLLHVYDVIDEEAWISLIQTRYESLLREIFE